MATAATVVAVALSATGCGAPEALGDDDPLERLHDPVTPDVLDQPLTRVTAPPVTAPAGSTWRVSNVIDGRTLELFQGLERVTATLGGIDVPVDDDCQAQLAKDSLTFITGGGRTVDVTPPDPIGNRIDDALIRNPDGDDLALVMLTLGLARVSEPGAPDPDAYVAAEAAARDERLGIWSDECDVEQ